MPRVTLPTVLKVNSSSFFSDGLHGVDNNSDHLRTTVFPVTVSNCLSHKEQDNTDKRKHLTGGWLTIPQSQSIVITVKAQHTGQHGPGAESFTL